MSSIKKNVVYSSILTVSGYLFPLITFPYVTRVLGVNNIGICNFVDSIVQYFIYISMMGITTIGIREIARVKGDKEKLSKTFNNLLFLNLTATIIAIILLLLAILFVPQLYEHKSLFYIGAAKVLANTLLVEWLFKGLEDFKYITTRSIIIRALYVVSVLVFVKTADDYLLYFFLTSFMVVANAIVNLLYSKKFVRVSLKEINFTPYVKSFLILGTYMLLTSMYTTFNVAYLGFVTNTVEVGYYTTATKLFAIILSFYSAFTGVMMPRMSALLSEGKIDEFKKLTNKSVDLLFAFVIPIIIIAEFCAPEIIRIVAGDGYEGAIMPMRIVMPLMLICGYEQILVLQMLSPMKKDTAILRNSIIGASVALLGNIIIVPLLASTGTAIVWVISEIAVMISAQYFVYKYVGYSMPVKTVLIRSIYAIPIILLSYLCVRHIDNGLIGLVVISLISFVGWIGLEYYVLKNTLLRDNLIAMWSKFRNK